MRQGDDNLPARLRAGKFTCGQRFRCGDKGSCETISRRFNPKIPSLRPIVKKIKGGVIMTEQKESRVKLPLADQIGIVVKDMDRAVAYYSSVFGWGPFSTMEVEVNGFTYKGKKGDCRLKIALASMGPIEIELIQVMEGKTPHSEFLREKGEGIQHLRFHVDDLDSMLAELAKDGIRPVFHHSYPEYGIAFAYLNSDKIGGVMFELIEEKKM
jgi:catechol 2,3-dioxygenase-like lactoylglutathione lyase family enzyme